MEFADDFDLRFSSRRCVVASLREHLILIMFQELRVEVEREREMVVRESLERYGAGDGE